MLNKALLSALILLSSPCHAGTATISGAAGVGQASQRLTQSTTRASLPINTRTINATELQSWLTVTLTRPCQFLIPVWYNYKGAGTSLANGDTPFTIRAGIRIGSTTYPAARCSDGQRDDYVVGGERTQFCPVNLGSVKAAGTSMSVQYRMIFDSTQTTVPAGNQSDGVHNNEIGSGLTDRTLATSWSSSDPSLLVLFPPTLMLCLAPQESRQSAMSIGDSIGALGTQDNWGADYGYMQRGLHNAGVASVNSGGGGLPILYYIDGDSTHTAARNLTYRAVLPYVTKVMLQMGTNDITQHQTDTQICTNINTLTTQLRQNWGVEVIPFTLPPQTNSTNDGKFPSNDDIAWTYIQDANTKIRALQCGNAKYFDNSVAVSTGNLWTYGTPDGIHYNSTTQNAATTAYEAVLPGFMQ